jgi:hypothetical protein
MPTLIASSLIAEGKAKSEGKKPKVVEIGL